VADFEESIIVWRKSTTSNSGGCIEVAFIHGSVLVRDSVNPTGPVLQLSPAVWTAFLARVRSSEFDLDPS
jgi:hypothetical protein